MDSNVDSIHIIHQDGIPLLTVKLAESGISRDQLFEELFGGFSSAINTLILQLGHKELKSIAVQDGLLVYSFKEPVIFVAFTTRPEMEHFTKIFVKQVEYEFFKEYGGTLMDGDSYVRGEKYLKFKNAINTLYQQLTTIDQEHPQFLTFLPSYIPLHYMYIMFNLAREMIEKYPDATIRTIREVPIYFESDKHLEPIVERALGRYVGFQIVKRFLDDRFIVEPGDVLKLLNEISVSKYDRKDETFNIVLCPICRGRTSNDPICQFFSGFIEGAIGNPSITVDEITCKARGDESCKFKLNRK